MLQISGGKWDTFVCIYCGGRCVIHADEKEIKSEKDPYVSYLIIVATKIVWSKVDVLELLNRKEAKTMHSRIPLRFKGSPKRSVKP